LFLPAIYIVSQSYHHEMIPTILLITMAAARSGVPFPVLVETLLMALAFEILREAGVRMPKAVGQAVSIVGALVLGQAAVEAGIVSAPSVIVIALTAIAGFLIPSQTDSMSILRFLFMILAGVGGLFGILWGMILVLIHLVKLRSFGIPYMSPIAPMNLGEEVKEVMMVAPIWKRNKRQPLIGKENPKRGENEMPKPPEKDGNEV
ncbi:MAG: spore germination protein, partial [Peptostreptococcales bacterium]